MPVIKRKDIDYNAWERKLDDQNGKLANSEYTPTTEEKRYQQKLTQLEDNRPAEYNDRYAADVQRAIKNYQNRGPFSYDLNGDALYQQYKDQYIQQGKRAMQDTMGQAAMLTGGYGNSYAAQVGNQAYQDYMGKLNNVIPELYQMAYDRYRNEGEDMLNLYNLYNNERSFDYGKYRDVVGDYNDQLGYYSDAYANAYNRGYGAYADQIARITNYNNGVMDRNLALYDRQYQAERDALADQRYDDETAYSRGMDSIELAMSAAGSGSSGGSSAASGGSASNTSRKETLAEAKEFLEGYQLNDDVASASAYLNNLAEQGMISDDEAILLMKRYFPTWKAPENAGVKYPKHYSQYGTGH